MTFPSLVDVDIAWFGKRWFFDNGDLGFTALDNRFFTANLMARVNSDRTFFSKTNTKYVSFARAGGGAPAPLSPGHRRSRSPNRVPLKPPKRDYAIEAGVEILFGGEWGNATLRALPRCQRHARRLRSVGGLRLSLDARAAVGLADGRRHVQELASSATTTGACTPTKRANVLFELRSRWRPRLGSGTAH